jgi:hypothetical protein
LTHAQVDSCPRLTRLLVFGLSSLNDEFAHGHSNDGLARAGLEGLGTSVRVA